MSSRSAALVALLFASSAFAVPKIDTVNVKPNPVAASGGKPAEIEVSVSISRARTDGSSCDVRVDFGDGEGRTIDFGLASTRTLHHVYRKSGSFRLSAKGTGKTPCEGSREVALSVSGVAEKKAEPKKAEKKKAAKKKAEKKKAAKKSPPPKEEPK